MTGIFSVKGAVLKWLSIQCAPDNSFSKFSKPMLRAMDMPMADHKEYLPK